MSKLINSTKLLSLTKINELEYKPLYPSNYACIVPLKLFIKLKSTDLVKYFDTNTYWKELTASVFDLYGSKIMSTICFLLNLCDVSVLDNIICIMLPYSWYAKEFITFGQDCQTLKFDPLIAQQIESIMMEYTVTKTNFDFLNPDNLIEIQHTHTTKFSKVEGSNHLICLLSTGLTKGFFIECDKESIIKLCSIMVIENRNDIGAHIRMNILINYDRTMIHTNTKKIKNNILYVPFNEFLNYDTNEKKYQQASLNLDWFNDNIVVKLYFENNYVPTFANIHWFDINSTNGNVLSFTINEIANLKNEIPDKYINYKNNYKYLSSNPSDLLASLVAFRAKNVRYNIGILPYYNYSQANIKYTLEQTNKKYLFVFDRMSDTFKFKNLLIDIDKGFDILGIVECISNATVTINFFNGNFSTNLNFFIKLFGYTIIDNNEYYSIIIPFDFSPKFTEPFRLITYREAIPMTIDFGSFNNHFVQNIHMHTQYKYYDSEYRRYLATCNNALICLISDPIKFYNIGSNYFNCNLKITSNNIENIFVDLHDKNNDIIEIHISSGLFMLGKYSKQNDLYEISNKNKVDRHKFLNLVKNKNYFITYHGANIVIQIKTIKPMNKLTIYIGSINVIYMKHDPSKNNNNRMSGPFLLNEFSVGTC